MIGRTVSHYRIIERLGQGGMGVVYRAEDLNLGRIVALKFLPSDLHAGDEARQRFLIEAQAASRLDHPNICTVHDVVDTGEGEAFIVMACYDGEALDSKIARGPLTPRAALDLLTQIARGLAKAHDAGIIHRDIKPANVIVTDDGVAKIVDFGIAKLAGVTVTRDGSSLGTAAYMAPEQFSGRPVTPATDVWALGVLLYEMLTAHRPFDGESQAALLLAILHKDPPKLEVTDPAVATLISRLLRKMLAKNPLDRYQTAAEVLAELEDTFARTGLRATATPIRRRLPPRVIAVGVALLVTALTAAVLIRAHFQNRSTAGVGASAVPGARRMVAVMPFENLGPAEETFFADGITEEIISRLAAQEGLGVISRTSVYAYPRRGHSARDIGRDLGVDYLLEGTVRWEKQSGRNRVRVTPRLIRVADDTQVWGDRYDRELDQVFAVQSEIALNVIEQLGLRLARPRNAGEKPTGNLAAYESYLRASPARFAYSEQELLAGIAQAERATSLDPGFAAAHALLGRLHVRFYHHGFDRRPARLEASLRSIDRALALDAANPEAHLARGYLFYWGNLDHVRALEEFTTAQKLLPGDASVLASIGFVHRRQGKMDLALAELLEARRLDPHNETLLGETAQTLSGMRRFAEADDLLARGIADFPQHSFLHMLRFGNALVGSGSTARAREVLQAAPRSDEEMIVACRYALALFEKDFRGAQDVLRSSGQESYVTTMPFGFWGTVRHPKDLLIAEAQHLAGDTGAARVSWGRAAAILERAVRDSPDDDRARAALGLAYAGLGRRAEAVREAERAVVLCPVSRNSVDGATRAAELARVYAMTGDREKALATLRRILKSPATFTPHLLALDRGWDPLRGDPRFQALLTAP